MPVRYVSGYWRSLVVHDLERGWWSTRLIKAWSTSHYTLPCSKVVSILAAERNVTAPGFGARYLAFLMAKSRTCEDNFHPALLLRTAVRRLQHHCVPTRAVVGSMRSAAPCTALSLIAAPLFEQSAARRSTGSTTVQYSRIGGVCARGWWLRYLASHRVKKFSRFGTVPPYLEAWQRQARA